MSKNNRLFISDQLNEISDFSNIITEISKLQKNLDIMKHHINDITTEHMKVLNNTIPSILSFKGMSMNMMNSINDTLKSMIKTFTKEDPYLDKGAVVFRLLDEYSRYGNLIVAVDFDHTINDYNNQGTTYPEVVRLLKRCNEMNFRIVVWTARSEDDYDFIKESFKKNGVEIEAINENLLEQFDTRKIYYNILLDDRAGLKSTVDDLNTVIDMIEDMTA